MPDEKSYYVLRASQEPSEFNPGVAVRTTYLVAELSPEKAKQVRKLDRQIARGEKQLAREFQAFDFKTREFKRFVPLKVPARAPGEDSEHFVKRFEDFKRTRDAYLKRRRELLGDLEIQRDNLLPGPRECRQLSAKGSPYQAGDFLPQTAMQESLSHAPPQKKKTPQ